MASTLDLIVFDFDGTLADSAPWFAGVFNEVADRFGFRTLTNEELHRLRGVGTREIIGYLGIPMWKIPFIARHMRQQAAAQTEFIPLFPGVDATLHALHASHKRIAIVSSNSEQNIRKILGNANTRVIADFCCGASLFGKTRLLHKVIKNAAVASGATLFIGDETRDIEAARAASAIAGAVTWGYASTDILRSCKPDVLFERMQDIVDYCLAESSPADAPRPNKTSNS